MSVDLESAEFDEEEGEYDLEIGRSRDETSTIDDVIRPDGTLGVNGGCKVYLQDGSNVG